MSSILVLLIACAHPPEEPATPETTPEDTAVPDDPSVPHDTELPYANCSVSVDGWWTDDGSLEWTYTKDYDGNGDWSRYRLDDDADGQLEQGDAVERDDEARYLIYDHDDDDENDDADERWTYEYGTEGLLAVTTYDAGVDGEPDATYTRSYDEDGRVIRNDYDDGIDGVIDGAWTTTWTEAGGLTVEREEWDYELDSVLDGLEIRHWDADDEMVEEDIDEDGDGAWESVYTYDYDENGALTAYVGSIYDGGELDYTLSATYSFDEWGRVSGRESDYDLDGSIDFVLHYVYTCSGR